MELAGSASWLMAPVVCLAAGIQEGMLWRSEHPGA
jgi:hypothetical protein